MACQSTLLLALLFVATASLAHGYSIDGTLIDQVNVFGTLVCSKDGNVELGTPCPGIADVAVTLICPGIAPVVNVTAADGSFSIALNTHSLLAFNPLTCVIEVKLPLLSCQLLPVTGVLHAIPEIVTGVVHTVIGAVANIKIGLWVCIAL